MTTSAPYGDNSSARAERRKVKVATRGLKLAIAGAAAVNMVSTLDESGAFMMGHALAKEKLKGTPLESWPDTAMTYIDNIGEHASQYELIINGLETLGDPLSVLTGEVGGWVGGKLASLDVVQTALAETPYQSVLSMYPEQSFNMMALVSTGIILTGYGMYKLADDLGRNSYLDTMVKADNDNAVRRARETVFELAGSSDPVDRALLKKKLLRAKSRENILGNAHSPHKSLDEITNASVLWRKIGPDSRSILVKHCPFFKMLSNPKIKHESLAALIDNAKLPMPFDHYLEREVNLVHLAALIGQSNDGASVSIKAMDLFRNDYYRALFSQSGVIVKELAHRVDDLKRFAEVSYQSLGPLAEHVFKNEKRLKGTLDMWDKLTLKSFSETIQNVAYSELVQFGTETLARLKIDMENARHQHQPGITREEAEDILDRLDRLSHAKPDVSIPSYDKLTSVTEPIREQIRILLQAPTIEYVPIMSIPITDPQAAAVFDAIGAQADIGDSGVSLNRSLFGEEFVLTETSTQEDFIKNMEQAVRRAVDQNYTPGPNDPSLDDMMSDYKLRIATAYANDESAPTQSPSP